MTPGARVVLSALLAAGIAAGAASAAGHVDPWYPSYAPAMRDKFNIVSAIGIMARWNSILRILTY